MSQERNEIHATTQSVRQLLNDRKYRLDYYQREYSWDTRAVEELISDLETKFFLSHEPDHTRPQVADYPHYFLGSIVVARKGGLWSIIDGQQRLTTLTLLLIYLNHLQQSHSEKIPLDTLILSAPYGQRSFNLDVDDRQETMDALYQGRDYTAPEPQSSQANLIARYEDITERFPETLSQETTLPYFIDWLLYNVDIVEITAYNDEDAYTIFETMNDRGRPLLETDMLKAYLLASVADAERRHELNRLWIAEMLELRALGNGEEATFVKAWLRSQYAEAIRQGGANAKPEDFDKLGTEFHRVVRDEHERFGLKKSLDYESFIESQLVRFADHYAALRYAEWELSPGLEFARFTAESGFALQPMVCLAPLCADDDDETAHLKMNSVAGYLDILIVRRVVNSRRITSAALRYAMFLLMKEVRGLSVPDLCALLAAKAKSLDGELPWSSMDVWELHGRNGKHVRNMLARMTSHIEAQAAMDGPGFDGYTSRNGKDPFDIEHIWADKPERHVDDFKTPQEFHEYRGSFGALLLLPASFNRAYGADPYSAKLEHYLGQNLLARSLHQKAYERHPGFARYIERSGLPFRSHSEFRLADLEQRQTLYRLICEEIFSEKRFADLASAGAGHEAA